VHIGRHSPQSCLARLYGRLLAAGKKPKVALTACMRKFIIMLNAVLRHQTPWNPEYSVALPSPFPPLVRVAAR
jgi:transposase